MNKKTILWLLIFSIIGFVVGYILSNPYELGVCNEYSIVCYDLATTGFALFYGMGALTLVFLVLLFSPQAFESWKKFAIWFVPLATLLFIFYPDPGSGDFFSPYPEQVFRWVSGLYVIVSLLIMGLKSIKKRDA